MILVVGITVVLTTSCHGYHGFRSFHSSIATTTSFSHLKLGAATLVVQESPENIRSKHKTSIDTIFDFDIFQKLMSPIYIPSNISAHAVYKTTDIQKQDTSKWLFTHGYISCLNGLKDFELFVADSGNRAANSQESIGMLPENFTAITPTQQFKMPPTLSTNSKFNKKDIFQKFSLYSAEMAIAKLHVSDIQVISSTRPHNRINVSKYYIIRCEIFLNSDILCY